METTEKNDSSPLDWIAACGGLIEDFEIRENFAIGQGQMTGWGASLLLSHQKHAEVSKHIHQEDGRLLMLSIAPLTDDHPVLSKGLRVRWESTLLVSEGRYVRCGGYATDFPNARDAIVTHQHECRTIGSLKWWKASDNHWLSWLGSTKLEAQRFDGSESRWHFSASGEAPSLEEAALLASIRF